MTFTLLFIILGIIILASLNILDRRAVGYFRRKKDEGSSKNFFTLYCLGLLRNIVFAAIMALVAFGACFGAFSL